jgi:hypothetical protein
VRRERRHHDDEERRIVRFQRLERLETARSREAIVEKDDVGPRALNIGERDLAGVDAFDRVTGALERPAEVPREDRLVLDDEDVELRCATARLVA